jgi:hypothetical protein
MNPYATVVLGFLGWTVIASIVACIVGGAVRLRDLGHPDSQTGRRPALVSNPPDTPDEREAATTAPATCDARSPYLSALEWRCVLKPHRDEHHLFQNQSTAARQATR